MLGSEISNFKKNNFLLKTELLYIVIMLFI